MVNRLDLLRADMIAALDKLDPDGGWSVVADVVMGVIREQDNAYNPEYNHTDSTIRYVVGLVTKDLHPAELGRMGAEYRAQIRQENDRHTATVRDIGRAYIERMLNKADEVIQKRKT